jgi:AraC family transcriptional regulator
MRTYLERLNEVIEYIELNLDKKLDLDILANIACISKYHFHRLIKFYIGEPLGAHINRLRIEKGARLLKHSGSTVTEIAYKIGYESPTSFTKSFKKQFNVSPSLYRKYPNHSFESVKKVDDKTNFNLLVSKKRITPFKVIYRTCKGNITLKKMFGFWKEFIEFAVSNYIIFDSTCLFGIHLDDPSVTLEQHRRFEACIRIDGECLNKKIPIKEIAGGNYLCFTFEGDFEYMGDVYDQIFRDYIIKDNIRLRDEPIFEQYLNDRNITPREKILTEIYFPIH